MGATAFDFSTGGTLLADVGRCEYNGCRFSPLFTTKLSVNPVKDEAVRTTKLLECSLEVDGYVTTHNAFDTTIDPTMRTLRRSLTVQGGPLTYTGRGMDLYVNVTGLPAGTRGLKSSDVAWGPIPELLEFQPLGGGLSAKVRWRIKFCIYEGAASRAELLQLNFETSVSYGEDGYSSLSVRGTMEAPLNRQQALATSRNLTQTVDDFRNRLETRILAGIDLGRFRPTKRDFNVSRDKRTMTFDYAIEEKPYMDLPPPCTLARGNFDIRPKKSGSIVTSNLFWMCSLEATYTVRPDYPRRAAWVAFLWLLTYRMRWSKKVYVPDMSGAQSAPPPQPGENPLNPLLIVIGGPAGVNPFGGPAPPPPAPPTPQSLVGKPWLFDFRVKEGLYQDSKTTSFSATWQLVSSFQTLLLGSGLWRKPVETDSQGRNYWAMYMRDVMKSKSWLENQLDPTLDVIVDLGSAAL